MIYRERERVGKEGEKRRGGEREGGERGGREGGEGGKREGRERDICQIVSATACSV